MEDFAFGELALMPSEFYDMTWGQYQRCALGYRIREDKDWQRARSIMWAAIQPHTKRQISPRDFYESIFDKGPEPINKTEADDIMRAWNLKTE